MKHAQPRQQPPPRGMFHLLMHIGHLLEERCRSGLSEYGLHHGQARVLMALGQSDGLVQARLASGLDIAAPTVSIMLKKLAAEGLVVRSSDASNQRVQRIFLTAEGRSAVKRVTAVWDRAQAEILDSIAPPDRQMLHACLLNIRNALGGRSPQFALLNGDHNDKCQ